MDLSVAKSQRRSSVVRKPGRPVGSNRVPQTLEERRARNAEYERQRREDIGDALRELAASVNLDSGMTPGDLLAEVVNFLRKTEHEDRTWSINALRRSNDNLATQIEMIEHGYSTTSDVKLHMKRDLMEDGDWLCPPSKRFSPDREFPDQFRSARTSPVPSHCQSARTEPVPDIFACVHKPEKRQRAAQFLQHSTSDSYFCQAQQGRVPELHSSCLPKEPSNLPQSCSRAQPLSVACNPVSTPRSDTSPPLVPASQVSCRYAAHSHARPKDLEEMTTIWRNAEYVAGNPQISMDQIDFFATEEDLVLLYF